MSGYVFVGHAHCGETIYSEQQSFELGTVVQNSLPKLFQIEDKSSLMHELEERVDVSKISLTKQIGQESRRMHVSKVTVLAVNAREPKREAFSNSVARSIFLK